VVGPAEQGPIHFAPADAVDLKSKTPSATIVNDTAVALDPQLSVRIPDLPEGLVTVAPRISLAPGDQGTVQLSVGDTSQLTKKKYAGVLTAQLPPGSPGVGTGGFATHSPVALDLSTAAPLPAVDTWTVTSYRAAPWKNGL